ncbi:hypothetical protein TNCT_687661 [Trichonephila clavata]|uniref:Uncharacterized protein n=1 Tax=Trichonephila clavata TaxID=2740835 RepID=A0A8X6HLB8_TRICU|nr:hypothetical protein TNCT_687661 [Trichonephila clavata]
MTPCPDLLHCALGRALHTKTVPRPLADRHESLYDGHPAIETLCLWVPLELLGPPIETPIPPLAAAHTTLSLARSSCAECLLHLLPYHPTKTQLQKISYLVSNFPVLGAFLQRCLKNPSLQLYTHSNDISYVSKFFFGST